MDTDFKTSFENDLKKIIDQTLKEDIKQTILSVEEAKTMKDIPELKKIKGYKKGIFYRIKVGSSYRIGVTIEGNLVTFVTFMHRKDIYKHFP